MVGLGEKELKKIPLKKISFAHLILHPHHHLQQEKEVTLMIS